MNLPLKNFGKSKKTKPVGMVRFLSFGHIIYQKNIDLLIEAGNLMYERGLRGFKISIMVLARIGNSMRIKLNIRKYLNVIQTSSLTMNC